MYTETETRAMLSEAAILVVDHASYRINYVPAVDEEDSDYIRVMDEDDGDEEFIAIKDIDLSSPSVLLYKLTLMNT